MITAMIAALSLTAGAGKALNNINTRLPGYVGSVHASLALTPRLSLDAGYTRIEASQLGENAAISTAGVEFKTGNRLSLGFSVITGASYSAAVWWDSAHPEQTCGVEGCGKRYENDGTHYSRACHLCGAEITAALKLTHGFGVRAEYAGLRHMSPTFQGTIVQVTYTIGAR